MRPAYTTRGGGTVLQKMRSDDANNTESSFSLWSLCSTVFQTGYLVYWTSHSHVHLLNVFSPPSISYSLSLSTYPVLSSRHLHRSCCLSSSMCQTHVTCLTCVLSFNPHLMPTREELVSLSPFYRWENCVKRTDVICLCRTASTWQSWNLNPGVSDLNPTLLTISLE